MYGIHLKEELGIQLIGISGYSGTGKDTLARHIHMEYQDCYIESFAGPIKKGCEQIFGIPEPELNSVEGKKTIDPFWKASRREILQFVGTEMFRETIPKLLRQIQGDFWIQRLYGKLTGELLLEEDGVYGTGDTVIIPDVRFQNEVDFIESQGGVIISLIRSGYEERVIGIPGHASEKISELNFNPMKNYRIINDGTFVELYLAFEGILNSLRAINQISLANNGAENG